MHARIYLSIHVQFNHREPRQCALSWISVLTCLISQVHECREVPPGPDILWRMLYSGCVISIPCAIKCSLDCVHSRSASIGHAATISTLSYAIRFWSKGTKRALFLRHEGFL